MTDKEITMRNKPKVKPAQIAVYAALIAGSAIMLIPFLWMILTSFKTYKETITLPIIWLPSHWKLDNYVTVLEKLDFLRYYRNTILVTFTTVTVMTFLASLAAFTFARMDFPGKNLLFGLLLVVYMVPPQMTMLPKYIMISRIGWVDTLKGIVIPNLFSVYTCFMLRQFFSSLPRDLDDAAKLDGCSFFQIYWRIDLPLCKNGLIAITVLNVLWSWNDLLWPLLATSTDKMRVLSVAIATMQSSQGTEYQLLMAAGVLAVLPMFVMYAVCQNYFMEGVAYSGTKG